MNHVAAAPLPAASRPDADAPTPPSRSRVDRVTSGRRHWLRGDGRSREARRALAIYRQLRDALPGPPTAVQEAFLRAAATLGLRLELLGSAAAHGGAVDDQTLVSVANAHARLLERLGISPAAPEARPDPRAEALARVEAMRRGADL